ncbi:PREDICTED: uncharacterized protein LOC105950424 [Erythranthe guttata]|uniref:uncharacterized protein LOC105950424 n=1 Tax=Erythranthe guttata TaxID=4155 RepID=UPI00064DD51D|nr:PREDICTED: uncharacterized protein LOC105950424 [Erythranthe guttata]|eukprot:XP_012829226.1 PREDICTED: uncharacterized protein LOC105950424 [Erythranthe guttata]
MNAKLEEEDQDNHYHQEEKEEKLMRIAILRNPLSDRRIAAFSPNSYRLPALPYSHRRISLSKPSKSITACSVNPPESNPYPVRDTLSGSTRTFATIGAVALAASKVIAPHCGGLFTLAVKVKEPVVKSAGPAFFAAVRRSELRSLNTPLTVVAAGWRSGWTCTAGY